MWETSRYRLRNYLRGSSARSTEKPAPPKPRLHLSRVSAEVRVSTYFGAEPRVVPVRLVLQDLKPESVTLFASQELREGQEIQLTLLSPSPLVVRGTIRFCMLSQLSRRIFSRVTYPYRVGIQFEFLNEGDRAVVEAFCQNP